MKYFTWLSIAFWVCCALMIAGIIGVSMGVFGSYAHTDNLALVEARGWADSLGMPEAKVTCSNMPDSSGYVACTVVSKDRIIPLECSAVVLHGCRVQWSYPQFK